MSGLDGDSRNHGRHEPCHIVVSYARKQYSVLIFVDSLWISASLLMTSTFVFLCNKIFQATVLDYSASDWSIITFTALHETIKNYIIQASGTTFRPVV